MVKYYLTFLLLFVIACQEEEDSFRDIVEKNADREILNDFSEQWQPRLEGQDSTYYKILDDGSRVYETEPETSYKIDPPFPNPFSDSTLIVFSQPERNDVTVTIRREGQNTPDTLLSDIINAGYDTLTVGNFASGYYMVELHWRNREETPFGYIKVE